MSVSKEMVAGLWLLGYLLSGCSQDSETPEARLRATLQAGEVALEQRDLGAVMGVVHPDYRAHDGRDYQQLRGLLLGYLLRHKSIYILSRIEGLEINPETGDAKVRLYAGVAGGTQAPVDSFDHWHGDLLYLELSFHDDAEGGWLLTRSRWESVRAESI
ncbi:MAG: hypothetical protein P8101_19555 [Candidatus Thiodiazotropha sp.]|jgi:hypothetical protein